MCANGPGFLANFPTQDVVSYSIFEIVRGTNQSIAQILSNKVNIREPFIEDQLIKGHNTNRPATALHRSQIMTRVVLEDVIGIYGQPYLGDVSILYQPGSGNTTLQIYFSQWAYGRLLPVVESNTTFSIEWDTNIIDNYLSHVEPVPGFWVDFGVADSVLLRTGEFDLYKEYEYIRNATLDTFPAIPWTPDSCGPPVPEYRAYFWELFSGIWGILGNSLNYLIW